MSFKSVGVSRLNLFDDIQTPVLCSGSRSSLDSSTTSCLGVRRHFAVCLSVSVSVSVPSAHVNGESKLTAATSTTTPTTPSLALDPVTKPLTSPVFLHLRTTNLPGPNSIMRSEQAYQREGLSADITNTSACGDDVLDCDVAHQSHVSAHLFLPCRSFVSY